MKNILFIKKQGVSTYSTEDIMKLFEGTDDLEQIKSAVEQANDRIFVSWASVEMKDKAGEIIPIDDIIKQQDSLLERNGPITDEHTNRVIGETLAWKVLEHPMTKTFGVLHLNKIFDQNDYDAQVWKEIQSGERTGSSVGGYTTSESQTKDTVTNSDATVLEGFTQFETASVFDPCNPLALNEAVSVVAKSNKTEIKPTDKIMAKIDNVINKISHMNSIDQLITIKNKGDIMGTNKIMEKLDTISKGFEAIDKRLSALEKEDVPEEDKPEEDVVEEKKKKQDEEEEKPVEEEKKKQEDEPAEEEPEKEEELITKEEARSDIPGETGSEEPESPEPDQPSDQDVYKKVLEKMDKMEKRILNKVSTPRAGSPAAADRVMINKAEKASQIAMGLATGSKKMTWMDVHKTVRELQR